MFTLTRCVLGPLDLVIGCLALAEDWTERVPLDQLFREAVSRLGLCISGMGESLGSPGSAAGCLSCWEVL